MYPELVKVLRDYFSPKQLEIMQKSKFYSRSRKPGENEYNMASCVCLTIMFLTNTGHLFISTKLQCRSHPSLQTNAYDAWCLEKF